MARGLQLEINFNRPGIDNIENCCNLWPDIKTRNMTPQQIEQLTELKLSLEYYTQKSQECTDIVTELEQWARIPDSALSFSVNDRVITRFKVGPHENTFLHAVFMSLVVYYRRKAHEARGLVAELEGPLPDPEVADEEILQKLTNQVPDGTAGSLE